MKMKRGLKSQEVATRLPAGLSSKNELNQSSDTRSNTAMTDYNWSARYLNLEQQLRYKMNKMKKFSKTNTINPPNDKADSSLLAINSRKFKKEHNVSTSS